MQLAIRPDAAFDSGSGVLVSKLKRFKPDDECGNNVTRVTRKDRHGYHLIDSSAGLSIFLDVANLLGLGQFVQGQLRFLFRIRLSHVVRIQRLYYRARAIEKAIKSRMERLCCLLWRRFLA